MGMKFGIEKCAMLIMKQKKKEREVGRKELKE